jgi:phage/plasmid-associated DNA primase
MTILEGDSSAGKTSLSNLIVALIGEDRCVQLRTEHLEKQFELDALRGRSLLLGNDVGANFLNTPGAQTLKGLVSTDLYHPEAKNRRDRRPLKGPFNILIGTNCRLTYRAQGDAAAWRRRLVIYPCRKPEGRKRVTNFEHVLLKEEGPGIVNLLLAGCRRALKQIEDAGDLELSDAQVDRVERLILRSEPIESFVTRCLVDEAEADVTAQELLEAFAAFCHSRGWKVGPEDAFFAKVGEVIADRFGVSRSHCVKREQSGKTKQLRGWFHLKLLDEGWRKTAVD